MNKEVYGVYKSANARTKSGSACTHKVAVGYRGEEVPHHMVEYKCLLCNIRHNFSLDRRYNMSSPRQEENFLEYCDTSNIEVID